jgi:hypothetical protein
VVDEMVESTTVATREKLSFVNARGDTRADCQR